MHENSSILYESIPINMISFRLMSFISQMLIIALFPASAISPVNMISEQKLKTILLIQIDDMSLKTILKLKDKKAGLYNRKNNEVYI